MFCIRKTATERPGQPPYKWVSYLVELEPEEGIWLRRTHDVNKATLFKTYDEAMEVVSKIQEIRRGNVPERVKKALSYMFAIDYEVAKQQAQEEKEKRQRKLQHV